MPCCPALSGEDERSLAFAGAHKMSRNQAQRGITRFALRQGHFSKDGFSCRVRFHGDIIELDLQAAQVYKQ